MECPVVAAFHLSPSQRQLVDFWLSSSKVLVHERFTVSDLGQAGDSLHYYPELHESDLEALLGWPVPVTVVAGDTFPLGNASDFMKAGGSSLWKLPAPGEPVIFPPNVLPEARFRALLFERDQGTGRLLRSVLRHAGFRVRFDFRSPSELAEAVADEAPDLVLFNLDDSGSDTLPFFHKLERILRGPLREKTRILVSKDISQAGMDMGTLASKVRMFTRRIFHPRETVLALLEGLLLHDPARKGERMFHEYLGLEQILFGRLPALPKNDPRPILGEHVVALERFRRILPFLWIYDHFASETTPGLVLAPPQP